jgi:hypothetical protein
MADPKVSIPFAPGSPLPKIFPDTLGSPGFVRGGVPQNAEFKMRDNGWGNEDGIPLTVVATGPNEVTGAPEVTLEDPDGVIFDVPKDLVPAEMWSQWASAPDDGTDKGFKILHTDFKGDSYQKVLEIMQKAWSEAKSEADDPRSILNPNNPGYKGAQGGFGGSADDGAGGATGSGGTPSMMAGQPLPPSGTGWRPQIPTPRPPTIRRAQDIPPEAGSGLGNWDQVWNGKRWVKDPSL